MIAMRKKTRFTVIGGKAGESLLVAWTHPPGTEVLVTHDDGIEYPTRTRSAPWMISGHPSILLEGISGGFALSRVRVPSDVRLVHLAARSTTFHAEAGCGARLTRKDALTADVDRVTCRRCNHELRAMRLRVPSSLTSTQLSFVDAAAAATKLGHRGCSIYTRHERRIANQLEEAGVGLVRFPGPVFVLAP